MYEIFGGKRIERKETKRIFYSTTKVLITLILNYDDLVFALSKDTTLEKFIDNLNEN